MIYVCVYIHTQANNCKPLQPPASAKVLFSCFCFFFMFFFLLLHVHIRQMDSHDVGNAKWRRGTDRTGDVRKSAGAARKGKIQINKESLSVLERGTRHEKEVYFIQILDILYYMTCLYSLVVYIICDTSTLTKSEGPARYHHKCHFKKSVSLFAASEKKHAYLVQFIQSRTNKSKIRDQHNNNNIMYHAMPGVHEWDAMVDYCERALMNEKPDRTHCSRRVGDLAVCVPGTVTGSRTTTASGP